MTTEDLPEFDDRCHTCGTEGQLANIGGALYCSDCFMRSLIGVTFEEAVAPILGDETQQIKAVMVAQGKAFERDVPNEIRLELAQSMAMMGELIDSTLPYLQHMLKAGVSPAGVLSVMMQNATDETREVSSLVFQAFMELTQRGWLKDVT